MICLHSTVLDLPSHITFPEEFQAIILILSLYNLCFQTPSYYLSAYEISIDVPGSPTDISHHGTGHTSSVWLMLLEQGQVKYGSHSLHF